MWMSHGDKLHEVPEGFKAVGMYNIYIGLRRFAMFHNARC